MCRVGKSACVGGDMRSDVRGGKECGGWGDEEAGV